jgi:hypothetical protein
MNAVHINWTKPYFVRNRGGYEIEDFEILTTILSALKWREKNGNIKMITDTAGALFYHRNGMEGLWNGGIEAALDDIQEDPYMFWAAGKLHALKMQKTPVAVIDTDFIVWEKILCEELPDLTVIHDEELYHDVYPDPDSFIMKDGYRLDPSWDRSAKPLNTAFYIIKNRELLDYYTAQAIHFMESAVPNNDPLTYMVFAEQRLLAMCAVKKKCEVRTFSTLERLFRNGEGWFTHTWGMKQQMRDVSWLRADFCQRCIGRIIRDYPDTEEMLRGIGALKKYFG